MQNNIPVLIVGAGPTGLTMAVELERYQVPFRIIDKTVKPVITSNALAVQTRTLYAWEQMGLLNTALSKGEKIRSFNYYANNKQIANIDFKLLSGNISYILGLSQHDTEEIMIEQLNKKHISVESTVSITNIEENNQGILVYLKHKNGDKEIIQTSWLIACDGGHSYIRDKLSIPFIGNELSQHFVLADAIIDSNLARDQAHLFISEHGLFALLPFNKDYFRIIAEVSSHPTLKSAKSLTYEQVKELAETLCPFNLTIHKPIWTSGFWIHENMIASYRHNHIFFAGDAAHIHSPAGGQGMNTGIQDAHNLAWKLSFVIQKRAKEALLDTYEIERRQVGIDIVRNTTFLTNIMTTKHYFIKMLRNYIISVLSSYNYFRKKLANMLTQLNIKYQKNLIVRDCLPWRSGHKAGTFKADTPQAVNTVLNTTGFSLLIFGNGKNHSNLTRDFIDNFKFAHLVKCIYINKGVSDWQGISIEDTDMEIHKNFRITTPTLFLIRPDKYIGFRGEFKHKNKLNQYLTNFSHA